MPNQKVKPWTGLAWGGFERLIHVFGLFAVQIVLARLLTPEDFGIVAIAMALIAICSIFIDAGLGNSIVQKRELLGKDASSILIVNVCLGLMVSAILWLSAPVLGRFYEQPDLTHVLKWLSLIPLVGSVGVVPNALLLRNLKYRSLMMVNVPSVVISGGVGIIFALNGYGIWALVVQLVLMHFVKTLLALIWCGIGYWRGFEFSALKRHLPFGGNLLLANFINEIFNNIYSLIIGYAFTPVEVGYFQRARSIQQLPAKNISQVIARVYFPLMSKSQDTPEELSKLFWDSIRLGAYSLAPILILIVLGSPVLVPQVLGFHWLPMVEYLIPICMVGIIYPLSVTNMNLLLSVGRSDVLLKLEIFKKSLVVLNIIVMLPLGILQMLYGMVAVSMINLSINIVYGKAHSKIGLMRQWGQVLRVVALSLVGGLTLVTILEKWNEQSWSVLFWAYAGGVLSFLGVVAIFDRATIQSMVSSLKKVRG